MIIVNSNIRLIVLFSDVRMTGISVIVDLCKLKYQVCFCSAEFVHKESV